MPDTSPQPVAVQIGAGNIGRGFMAELFDRGGYRVTFIEVDPAVLAALADRGEYEIHHITSAADEAVRIGGVRGIDARDAAACAAAIADCAVAATAVGVRALEAVAPTLAAGIARRLARADAPPLNVITCENLLGAGRHLRDLVWRDLVHLAEAGNAAALDREAFEQRVGFVEAVVSRMVPVVPEEVRRRNPLWVACEPYARLPVDAAAVRGAIPHLAGLEPVEPIAAYQQRKLATHNMSHAACAYLGYRAGHRLIWQAMEDAAVADGVRAAMDETGRALMARYGFDADAQRAHEADLRDRYRNRALGDQVARVAADPLRKLGPDDRLIGSARLCLEEGVDPAAVLCGIRAALAYDPPDDPSAVRLQRMLAERGRAAVLHEVCGLGDGDPLLARLLDPDPAGEG
ncbi:MAG: mannitol-1-phosphate 5-dehydrogenase [Phycisphaerae bacterium]